MAKADLSADRLREILSYDPETGIFIWLKKTSRRANRIKIGSEAGCLCKTHGYVGIGVGAGRSIPAHQLAWLYMTGEMPTMDIDHIDGNRANNRWANLRHVSRSINMQNVKRARADSAHGLIGVELHRQSGLYHSRIKVSGRRKHLGYFKTPEEAHQAYLAAKRRLHEGCTI